MEPNHKFAINTTASKCKLHRGEGVHQRQSYQEEPVSIPTNTVTAFQYPADLVLCQYSRPGAAGAGNNQVNQMAEFYFVNGLALDDSNFQGGYDGSMPAGSFHLEFDDDSDVGKDSGPNGLDFTNEGCTLIDGGFEDIDTGLTFASDKNLAKLQPGDTINQEDSAASGTVGSVNVAGNSLTLCLFRNGTWGPAKTTSLRHRS